MLKIIGDLRSLLLALWLGAACYFSFAVAPSAFGILPSRDLAGSVVSRTLLILNLSGIAIGAILLLSSFLPSKNAKTAVVWIERILLGILTITCIIGQFVIGVWMNQIRTSVGRPIEELAVDDASRLQFDQLHIWSVNVLIAGMIAALLSYFILAYRSRNTENKEIKTTEQEFGKFKV
ncbi:MAG: DUF4149 domain-containing protein [Pyrinomonadaceae bacterium]|jgi:hypothetical protein|nr:DUF4149 domain-containing protein [Pyrinomonadaceae bacterium]